MLPKKHGLQKKKDIERVFKKGKGFKQDFLLLKTVNNDFNIPRFGFVVSQKISKKAVIRNKVKRRLREVIKIHLKKIDPTTDNLLITLSGIEKEDFQGTKEMLTKLFKKASILK